MKYGSKGGVFMRKVLLVIVLLFVLGGCNKIDERKTDAEKKKTFYEAIVVSKYIVKYENPSWFWSVLHTKNNETKFYIEIAYNRKTYNKLVTLQNYNAIQERDIYLISQYYWEYLEDN